MVVTKKYACGHEFTFEDNNELCPECMAIKMIEEVKEMEIKYKLPSLVGGKVEEVEISRIKRSKFVKIFMARRPEIKKRLNQMINEIDHSSQEYSALMSCIASENLYNDDLFVKGLSAWPYNLADYWIGFEMNLRFEYILGFCMTVIDVFAAAQSSKVNSSALMFVPLERV